MRKKRVAITGFLAMQPQVLVLDEPSSQLDPRSRRCIINLLQTLPITQLIATHDLDLTWELCERTIIFNQGQIQNNEPQNFLKEQALEILLSYSRPYRNLVDDSLINQKK